MPDITVSLAIGRSISFNVRDSGPGPFFLLGVRKSGSSILNNICNAQASLDQRHFVDVGHTFFSANVLVEDWQADPALRVLLRPGNIFGGFRNMPLGLAGDPVFQAARKLLLVRDPRDALVSEYFSNAFSHSIPEKTAASDDVNSEMLRKRAQALTTAIGDFVVKMAPAMNATVMQYAPLVSDSSTMVLKYEDVILEKATLIAKMAAQFALRTTPTQAAQILGWADQRPVVEDPRAFVRRVRPGDHRDKLDTATIGALNDALAPAMRLFGYSA